MRGRAVVGRRTQLEILGDAPAGLNTSAELEDVTGEAMSRLAVIRVVGEKGSWEGVGERTMGEDHTVIHQTFKGLALLGRQWSPL